MPERLTRRRFVGTQLPVAVVLVLILLGLPRTILTDLGIITPEGSALYYLLALTPFAAWFVAAALCRTSSPIRDQLIVGVCYGLSLTLVHEVLWRTDASVGHHLPAAAARLAEPYGSPIRELILHGYAFGVAMSIGLGVGLAAAMIALIATWLRVRSIRTEDHESAGVRRVRS